MSCIANPIFDVIIGNVPGVLPYGETVSQTDQGPIKEKELTCAVTRAEAVKQKRNLSPLPDVGNVNVTSDSFKYLKEKIQL